MSQSDSSRRTVNESRDESGELVLLEDKTDMTFLDSLMQVIRQGSRESRFNKCQLKLLSDRCGAIHRTLAMMHHTTPSPNTLSAFRSAEYLVNQHVGQGWETFLVHRFTATELFEQVRVKIRMVWSLQSTARWESQEQEAAAKDAKENIALMRSLNCVAAMMPVLPNAPGQGNAHANGGGAIRVDLANDDEVVRFYQRRSISGWKLPWHQVDVVNLQSSLPSGGAATMDDGNEDDEATKNQNSRRYFRRPTKHETHRFSYAGFPMTCFELGNPDYVTPKTIENFIVDMKCRYNWSHPNLVKCVGGFAEKFHPRSEIPYLSLGAWFEDLESKAGYVSLHELLYTRGRKYHIATAIQMVLLIADALQYAIFSSIDVSQEVADAWSQISPSRILVSTDDHAAAEEIGRSKTVDRVPGMQGECHVRFLPGFYVENEEVSRWTAPVDAGNKACYGLSQLLCCLLSSSVPFGECVTQEDITRVRGGRDYVHRVVDVPVDGQSSSSEKRQQLQAVHREEEPDSLNLIPKMIPKPLQDFLAKGLARKPTAAKMKREADARRKKDEEMVGSKTAGGGGGMLSKFFGKMFMMGVSVDVAEDTAPQYFTSIQQFRRELTKIARQPGLTQLNIVSPHISKVAATSPCPEREQVHLEETTLGANAAGGVEGVDQPQPGSPFAVDPQAMERVHENEIHKGHDVGPIGDFKLCTDYGYRSGTTGSRSAVGVHPMNPPVHEASPTLSSSSRQDPFDTELRDMGRADSHEV